MARKRKLPIIKTAKLTDRDSLELGRFIQMIVSDPKMRDLVRSNPARALTASKITLSPEAKRAFIDYAKQASVLTEGVDAVSGAFFFFFLFLACTHKTH